MRLKDGKIMEDDGNGMPSDEDSVFDNQLAIKQQSDLVAAINKLVAKIQPDDDSELMALLIKLSQSQDTFLNKLNDISKPNVNVAAPQVNVSNEQLSGEIKMLNDNISLLIQTIERPKEFNFKRDTMNLIVSPITVTTK